MSQCTRAILTGGTCGDMALIYIPCTSRNERYPLGKHTTITRETREKKKIFFLWEKRKIFREERKIPCRGYTVRQIVPARTEFQHCTAALTELYINRYQWVNKATTPGVDILGFSARVSGRSGFFPRVPGLFRARSDPNRAQSREKREKKSPGGHIREGLGKKIPCRSKNLSKHIYCR